MNIIQFGRCCKIDISNRRYIKEAEQCSARHRFMYKIEMKQPQILFAEKNNQQNL